MSEDILKMQTPEVPVITIERDDDTAATLPATATGNATISQRRLWLRRLLKVAVLTGIVAALLVAFKFVKYYYMIGVPTSVSPKENIAKLQATVKTTVPEVIMTSDSILGVGLNFYELRGLQGAIEFKKPTVADSSVYLFTRCADYSVDHKYLGSLVAEGKEFQSDRSRLGYMGMADGNMVIGIARSDAVKDYVKERGGSFFRQFILVSDGVLPPKFHLHGKVERRAIGRKGDALYYIATRHKETMWDFADALREYGFIDAIYITGGDILNFYRDRDKQAHAIGNSDITLTDTVPNSPAGTWLVLRPTKQ